MFNRFEEVSTGVITEIDLSNIPAELKKSRKGALSAVTRNVEAEKTALNALLGRPKVSSTDLLDVYTEMVEVASELEGEASDSANWGSEKSTTDLAQLGARAQVLAAKIGVTLRAQLMAQEFQLLSCSPKTSSTKAKQWPTNISHLLPNGKGHAHFWTWPLFMPATTTHVWRGRSFDFAQDRLSSAKTALRLEIPFWKHICRPCSFVTDMKLGSNSLWNRDWRTGAPAPRVPCPPKLRRWPNTAIAGGFRTCRRPTRRCSSHSVLVDVWSCRRRPAIWFSNTASEKAASGHSRARAPVPHEGWKCSLIGVTFASGCKAPFQDRLSLVRPKPTYTLSLFTQSKLRHRSPALTLMLP